jgi:VIT1/CCC1 family predicted Fe2+/Mn2+ transporter
LEKLADNLLTAALKAQKTEFTEGIVYARLAALCKDTHNADVLAQIGKAEVEHGKFWQNKTGREVKPNMGHVRRTVLLARVLGLSFILKRMEKNEGTASKNYEKLIDSVDGARALSADEAAHEAALLDMLDEEKLRYAGAVVLGLNDALVELTGSLAGFTLSLGNTRTISMAGLVTGIAASFSMAASAYLSARAETDAASGGEQAGEAGGSPHDEINAGKSALYTGIAYVVTVALLILPFLLLQSAVAAMAITLVEAIIIIALFNYYLATARGLNFKRRFLEMAGISLSVAALSFVVGWFVNKALGV